MQLRFVITNNGHIFTKILISYQINQMPRLPTLGFISVSNSGQSHYEKNVEGRRQL